MDKAIFILSCFILLSCHQKKDDKNTIVDLNLKDESVEEITVGNIEVTAVKNTQNEALRDFAEYPGIYRYHSVKAIKGEFFESEEEIIRNTWIKPRTRDQYIDVSVNEAGKLIAIVHTDYCSTNEFENRYEIIPNQAPFLSRGGDKTNFSKQLDYYFIDEGIIEYYHVVASDWDEEREEWTNEYETEYETLYKKQP